MMGLVVSIPTTNRPLVVASTVRDIARQTRLPDLMLVVIASDTDIDPAALKDLPFPVRVIPSERGLVLQRNTALQHLGRDDVLLFLDDDFLMAPDYLQTLERLFAQNPDVVMVTGTVLEDGIHGPGLDFGHAQRRLAEPSAPADPALEDIYNCYGCNMAVRARPLVDHEIRLDERLKLYAWLEDVDFSRQMAAHGRIVKSPELRGVHLGTKIGRSKGVPLGYAQVANPLYLLSKGTMSLRRVLTILSRNLISNLVKSLMPEPEIDRWGRLKGNLTALADLVRGRMSPERLLEFK